MPASLRAQDAFDQYRKHGQRPLYHFISALGRVQSVYPELTYFRLKSGDIRDLLGAIDREKAAIGIFVTLEPPTSEMVKEAASTGYYVSPTWNQDCPKIQILTIGDLLAGKAIRMPPAFGTFKQAPKVKKSEGKQGKLDF